MNPPNGVKPTSPSPAIQQNVSKDWGANKGTTSPQEALANRHTKKPVAIPGK